MLEVELKAWGDLDAAARRLEKLGKRLGKTSVKEDLYFAGPGVDPSRGDPLKERMVRVRVEGDSAVVTAKRKKIDRGVETSEEIEATVSPPEQFRELLAYMGYTPFIRKRKESRSYEWRDGVHVELNRVEGLGDFVEIEALLPQGSPPEQVARVHEELRAILREVGVEESRIEPKPYVILLREKNVR